MATREKALVDLIENRRNVTIRSRKEMTTRLLEDLRMDQSTLSELNIGLVEQYATLYGSVRAKLLTSCLIALKGGVRND
jgi:hypothetical protein